MLLEREGQLAELRGLLAAAQSGGQLALIGGEAGAGKSALVAEFAKASASGTILVGRCDDLFAPRPLGPLADIAREIGGALREAIESGHAAAAFDAFLDLLADGRRPTIVVLEDLQWADDATLDLLRFVARRLDRAHGLILATYRDDLPPDHALRQTVGGLNGGNVHRISLPALSVGAVRTLVGGRAIDPPALHRATGGNPFYVVEVLAAERWTIPSSVSDAVLTRAARLDRPSRDALDATAVLGASASATAVMKVAECAPAALETCVAAGLLLHHGDHLAFRHDLSRAAIEEAITPWRRRALHSRALEALAGSDDLVTLANHAIAAGDAEAICRLAPGAAARCHALGANRAAAAIYASAVAHSAGLVESERIDLYEAHARACEVIGDEHGALTSAAVVRTHLRDAGDARRLAAWLSWCASTASCTGRYVDEATAQAREAVSLLMPFGDSPELAHAMGAVATRCMFSRTFTDSLDYGARSLELAERFGDEALVMRMLTCLGTILGSCDDPHGLELLGESLARAERAGDPLGVVRAANNLGATLDLLWRPLEAMKYLDVAYGVATTHELGYRPSFIREEQAVAELLLGRWHEALATAVAVAADPELDRDTRTIALVVAGQIRSRRGEDGADAALSEAEALSTGVVDVQVLHPLGIARAEAHWFHGRVAEAREVVAELIPVHDGWIEPWRLGELALWCSRVGIGLPIDRTLAEPFALHVDGRCAEAADLFVERHCPYHAADALGDSTDEDDLRRSLAMLHDLGAARRAAQVTRRLRELGARGIPRGPRPATRSNSARLTAREVEVALLLADGLTNGEIADRLVVSSKTVDHHVSAVLAKLEVGNRRGVSAALDALDLERPGADAVN